MIVLVPLVAYPGSMLAGVSSFRLQGDSPTFPTAADCVLAPAPGEKVRVVFGYTKTYPEANALRDRTHELGVQGAEVAQDGCGRLRVFLDDVSSVAAGAQLVRSVRTPDLEPALERDPDG